MQFIQGEIKPSTTNIVIATIQPSTSAAVTSLLAPCSNLMLNDITGYTNRNTALTFPIFISIFLFTICFILSSVIQKNIVTYLLKIRTRFKLIA